MNDNSKTKQQLIKEMATMRQRVADLEKSRSEQKSFADSGILCEEMYRKLDETAHDIIITVDLNFKITYVNKATFSFTGGIDPVGLNLVDFTPLHLHQLQQEMMQKRRESFSDVLAFEWEIINPPSKSAIFDVRSTLLTEGGKPSGVMFVARDITERKRAEETLRQKEERYRTILENIQDGYWETDLAGTFTFVNDAMCRIVETPREQLLGKNNRNYTSKEEAKRIYQIFNGIYRTGEPAKGFAFEFIRRDGTKAFAEVSVSLIRGSKGNPIGFRGIARDITDRKKAEAQLHESEEKYRLVVENALETIIITQDLKIVFVNNAAMNFTGYSEEIIASRPFTDFIHSDDRNMVVNNHIRRLKGEKVPPIYSFRVVSRDESVRWFEINSIIIQWKGRPAILSFLNDITERKLAEEELRKSEEKYRQILENMEEGYFEMDLRGNYTFVNDAECRNIGYSREELIGMNNRQYQDEATAKRLYQIFNNIYKTGEPVRIIDIEIIRKNGTKRFNELSASLIRDSKGEKIGFSGVSRDITERKKLEDRLQRSEKMEALGTLAGGVAHDLNNVLGVLVGYSELLAEKLPEDSPLRRYADNILQSGLKEAAIIRDLLTLARRGVTVSEVVNLNKVVSDCLQTPELKNLKSYNLGVKIRADLEEGLLNIKGSPIHLDKTIMNLVSNATEAISDHGEVTIKTENRYLDRPIRGYDYVQEGDYVVLTISDTGRGISQRDIGKIFEPFYTKKVMGRSGTGLGLAVVWGTVKDHHGYIDVQSEEGNGSTFTLYFPVTREEPEIVEKAISIVSYMSKGESILVVDDVKEQRELAMSMLGRLGYQVEAVASGEEAIECLKNKKADLMVLDMIMDPGIDGMEAYRRILEINPGQKAVIVSGFSENDRVRKTKKMGAGTFVQKPYILEKIGLAVRKELDRK